MQRLSPLLVLRLYYFVAFGVMGLYLPYFPSWLRNRGFVGWQMSALVVLLPLCQLFSPSIVGVLADKWGLRGRMMTFCATATALGLTAFSALAATESQIPFVLAFLCMLAFALLRSPVVGLADVLAMEISSNYGRMRLWGSLGFMSMAFVGGRIVDTTHGFQLPVLITAGLWTTVLVSCLLPQTSHLPPRPALHDAQELLKQTAYRRLLLTMLMIFAGMTAYDLCVSMHLSELGANGMQIGVFWTIATCSEVLLMFFAARFVERIGPGKLLSCACFIAAGRWLFLSQATSMTLILSMQPLHALSFGLMWVSAIGVLKRELGQKGTATAHGLFSSAIACGSVIGLTLWGICYEEFGGQQVFLSAAVISFLAALSAARLIRLSPAEAQLEAVGAQHH